eukprot:COSAG06_NODE_18_length_34640_cov_31.179989_3_plen_68_part_00
MGVDARLRAISTHVRPAVAPSAAATAAVESPPGATAFRLLDLPSHEVEAAGSTTLWPSSPPTRSRRS